MDYLTDITIDETALDVEWLRQPEKMFQYAKHAADCRRTVDLAKEALELEKAKLDRDIRTNPEKYELSKITESVVQSTILTQESYKEITEQYANAKYDYDVATAAVRALDQKKTALENLVRLHGVSYFAGPTVPRDLNKEAAKNRAHNGKVRLKRSR